MILPLQVEGPILDFALQRSRIAVKNPRVRPPTDPRSLINMPSVDPTPSTPVSGKALPGVPLGGLGVGIKLPGRSASLWHISTFSVICKYFLYFWNQGLELVFLF